MSKYLSHKAGVPVFAASVSCYQTFFVVAHCAVFLCVVVATVVLLANHGFAGNLTNLTTLLYGGNGVPITRIFEQERPTGGIDVVTTVQIPLESFLEIKSLNSELNAAKGAFPVSSTGGGFTFQYDNELEVFTRTTDSLGPIFAERATTLGKRKINMGFSYSFIEYSSLQGKDVHSLKSIVLLDEKQKDANLLQLDFDIRAKTNLFAFYGTYGITDRWDVSVLVPIMQVQLDVDSTARILNQTKEKGREGKTLGYSFDSKDTMSDSVSGASTGVGDIFLRSKYNVFNSSWVDFTPALDIKLPTGNEEDLLGTGRTSVKPFLIFSKSINRFTPHFNLGYEFNSGSEGLDKVAYTTGIDYGFGKGNNHFSLAADVIGSHKIEKAAIGNNIIDFATGFKWSPRMGTLIFANVQTPMNDDGLRANWIPTVGYELNF